MKNNNQEHIKSINQTIDALFEQNGKTDIPDVKQLCALTKTPRKTILKYLSKWWVKHDYLQRNSEFLNCLPQEESKIKRLETVCHDLNHLIKEIELNNDALNYLSESDIPWANYLVERLVDVQEKIAILHQDAKLTQNNEALLQNEIIKLQGECCSMQEKIEQGESLSKKRINELQEALDSKRREAIAAQHLAKSLKREKRTINLKHVFNYQNM